jgi:hypothetical protein
MFGDRIGFDPVDFMPDSGTIDGTSPAIVYWRETVKVRAAQIRWGFSFTKGSTKRSRRAGASSGKRGKAAGARSAPLWGRLLRRLLSRKAALTG